MASVRPIAPRFEPYLVPPPTLKERPIRPTPLRHRNALADALEWLGPPVAIIPCVSCEKYGATCYFCPERTRKCTSCIREDRKCVPRLDMARFRNILDRKRWLQVRCHNALSVLHHVREAAAKAQEELLKAEVHWINHQPKHSRQLTRRRGDAIKAQQAVSRAEAEYNDVQVGMAVLDGTSRVMLYRELQCQGLLDAPRSVEDNLPDQNFSWMSIPGQENFCPGPNRPPPGTVGGGAAAPSLHQSTVPAGGFPPTPNPTVLPGDPAGEVPGGRLPSGLTPTPTGLAGKAAGPSFPAANGSTSPAANHPLQSPARHQGLPSSLSPAAGGLTPQTFAEHQLLFFSSESESSSWAVNLAPENFAGQQCPSSWATNLTPENFARQQRPSSWTTNLTPESFARQQRLSSSSAADRTPNASVGEPQDLSPPPSPVVSYHTPQSFAEHQILFSLPAPERTTAAPSNRQQANMSALRTKNLTSGASATRRHV